MSTLASDALALVQAAVSSPNSYSGMQVIQFAAAIYEKAEGALDGLRHELAMEAAPAAVREVLDGYMPEGHPSNEDGVREALHAVVVTAVTKGWTAQALTEEMHWAVAEASALGSAPRMEQMRGGRLVG